MPSAVPVERCAAIAVPQSQLGQPRVGSDPERSDAVPFLILNRGVERAVRPGERVIIAKGEERFDAETAPSGGSVTNHHRLRAVDEEDFFLQPRTVQIKRPDWKRIEAKFHQSPKSAGVKRAG